MLINKLRFVIFLTALFISLNGFSSEKGPILKGVVRGLAVDNGTAQLIGLPYANVYWAETTVGVTTDENGLFEISKPRSGNDFLLVVSFIGYTSDTVKIDRNISQIEITLSETVQLEEVTVIKRMGGIYISKLDPLKTEVITIEGLQSLACCNLAESFENSATVDVSFSDAVSGARRIQMLGLSGVYSQIMFENIPVLRGLASTYGMTYIPGSWMESIQISKGASSVIHGYESTTGQINVEYKKPGNSEKFFLNLYAGIDGRYESNINSAVKLNDYWSTMILAHASTHSMAFDHNHDSFIDFPTGSQINLINRWEYEVPGKGHSQFGIGFMSENRHGGQNDFNESIHRGTNQFYGIGIEKTRFNVFAKNGIFFRNNPGSSLGLIVSATLHENDAFFGINNYTGNHNSFYSNLIFETPLDERGFHTLSTGISYMYDDYFERFNNLNISRIESVPGIFGQYTYSPAHNFSLILGLRVDENSHFGTFVTPRSHLKWHITENTVLRGSAGKGYRTANVFAENVGVLASSRNLVFVEDFKAESAWNYGLNITQTIPISNNRNITLSADFYRTDFINRVITDMEQSTGSVYFYNLDGKSFSNSFQTDLIIQPFEGFEISAAFRYNEVKATINNQLLETPFISKHKGLLVLSYVTPFNKWQFNMTNQLVGKSRLPDTSMNPLQHQREAYSKPYYIMHAQITKKFRNLDVYLGGENLLNFIQKNPIIAADDPFGSYFDTSFVWGPLLGRKFYIGIRYTI